MNFLSAAILLSTALACTLFAATIATAADDPTGLRPDQPAGSLLDARCSADAFPDLSGANLGSCDLREADLSGGNFDDGDFSRSRLNRAHLRAASLRRVNFRDADLSDADLRGARLQGSNLFGVTLEGTLLEGAEYDDETIFPEGFEPSSVGMKRSESISDD